jgi:hypothetical protein
VVQQIAGKLEKLTEGLEQIESGALKALVGLEKLAPSRWSVLLKEAVQRNPGGWMKAGEGSRRLVRRSAGGADEIHG